MRWYSLKVPKVEYYNVLINSLNALAGSHSDESELSLVVRNQSNYKLMVDAFITSSGINNTVDTTYTTASFVNNYYTGFRVGVYPVGKYLTNIGVKDINLLYADLYLEVVDWDKIGTPPNENLVLHCAVYNGNGDHVDDVDITLSGYSNIDGYPFTVDSVRYLKNIPVSSATPSIVMLELDYYGGTPPQNYKEAGAVYCIKHDGSNFVVDLGGIFVGEDVTTGYLRTRQMYAYAIVKINHKFIDSDGYKNDVKLDTWWYYDTSGNVQMDYVIRDYYIYKSPPYIYNSVETFVSVYGYNMIYKYWYYVNTRERTDTYDRILLMTLLRKQDLSYIYNYSSFDNANYDFVAKMYYEWNTTDGFPYAMSEVVSGTGTYYQRGISVLDGSEISTSSTERKSLMVTQNINTTAVKISDTCWVIDDKIYNTELGEQVGVADNWFVNGTVYGDTFRITSEWGNIMLVNNKISLIRSVSVVPKPAYVISKVIDFGEVVDYVLPYAYYEEPSGSLVLFTITGQDPSNVIQSNVEIGKPIYVHTDKIRLRVDMLTTSCDAIPKIYSYGVIALG